MTLETIARLENALNIDIVRTALTYVSGYNPSSPSRQQYLNDSGGKEFKPDIKTSQVVEGYNPKKKG